MGVLILWEITKKPIYKGDCQNRGAGTGCRFKRGLAKKRRYGGLLRGNDTPINSKINLWISLLLPDH